jgi:aspartate racemase
MKKTIGLIGGISWKSSIEYYRIINEEIRARLGGHHSADCLLYSFDFADIAYLQMQDAWDEAADRMIEAARRLEHGGAKCIVICANTMHKVADAVQNAVDLPLIHIADPTAKAIRAQRLNIVGLLGTTFTMRHDFYKGRLAQKYELNVIVPEEDDMQMVNRVIYDELTKGIIRDKSREAYVKVIDRLAEQGAQGVILGCTEISLLIGQKDSRLPVFDTAHLHAVAAVDFALADDK